MMQRVFDRTSYANALEIYLDPVNCDVLTLETKDRGMAELKLLGMEGQDKEEVRASCRVASDA